MKDYSYGIMGYYSTGYEDDPNEVTPFGGFFKHTSENSIFKGMLIDNIGSSIIEGKLFDKILTFKQKYEESDYFIKYYFRYDSEKKNWKGQCIFPKGKPGKAFCKTFKTFVFNLNEEETLIRLFNEILGIKDIGNI